MVKLEWKRKDERSGDGFSSSSYDRIVVTTRRLKAYTLINGEECLLQDIVLSNLDKAIITNKD